MPILDDEGRLFGVVNIIDALVILLVVAVVAAGAALVLGSNEPQPAANNSSAPGSGGNQTAQPEGTTQPQPVTIVYRLNSVPMYLLDPIEEGPVNVSTSLVSVEDITIIEEGDNTVTAELTVETTVTRENGLTYYNGKRIYVGKTVTLDFGDVVVKPTVIRFA